MLKAMSAYTAMTCEKRATDVKVAALSKFGIDMRRLLSFPLVLLLLLLLPPPLPGCLTASLF